VRVLGVDPSLNITGYGVVEQNGSGLRLVEGGKICPRRNGSLYERLADLQKGLADVIAVLRPDIMVVEEVFSRTAYPRTAILMAHARGTLICTAAVAGLPVHDYAATAVKRALVGRGGASKDQVARMVVQALRLKSQPPSQDITDALALAIAFLRRQGLH
jgi:crossover junction endodeoxyribonuclease RuvC